MADLLDGLSEARRHLLFEFQALIGVFIRELGTLPSDPGHDRLPVVQPLIQSVYHDLMLLSEPYGMRSRHDALLFCLHEVSTTFVREVEGLSIGECLGDVLLQLCDGLMLGPDPDAVLAGRAPAEDHRVAMPDLARVESQLRHLEASIDSCHRMLTSLEDMFVREERTVCPPQFVSVYIGDECSEVARWVGVQGRGNARGGRGSGQGVRGRN
ncbi:hypothetical protein K474DRAFT_1707192 [Panus rudis PR-1116 ss-1]|nr:hypothetical protein K474DRAFT_1707192 [Panus rudis PR-1116 ss-1]